MHSPSQAKNTILKNLSGSARSQSWHFKMHNRNLLVAALLLPLLAETLSIASAAPAPQNQRTPSNHSTTTIISSASSAQSVRAKSKAASEEKSKAASAESKISASSVNSSPDAAPPLWKATFLKGDEASDAKNYTDAAKLYEQATAYAHELKPDGLEEAKCLQRSGLVYRLLGRTADAEKCLTQCLKIREKKLGENAPETGETLQDLAALLFNSDRDDEAIAMCRRALKNIQLNQGERSIEAADTKLRLTILIDRDDAHKQEADQLFQDVLSIQQEKFGDTSPKLVTTLTSYGIFLVNEKKFPEADRVLEKALKIVEQKGATTNDVSDALVELAFSAKKQGNHAKAIQLLEKALDIRALNKSDDTAEILEDIGKNYAEQDKVLEAEPFLRNAVEHYRKQKKVSAHTLIFAIDELAANLHDLQKYSEEETLLRETLELTKKNYPPNHNEVAVSLHNLSRNLRCQKKYAEAEDLLNKSLEIKKAQPKLDELDYTASLRNMARIKTLQGKFEDAIPYYEQCIEFYGKNNERYTAALNKINLANVYLELNKYTPAEQLLLSLVPEKFTTYSKTNPFLRVAEVQRETILDDLTDTSMNVCSKTLFDALKNLHMDPSRSVVPQLSELLNDQQLNATKRAEILIQIAVQLQSLGGDGSIVARQCFPLLSPQFETAHNRDIASATPDADSSILAHSLISLACVMASCNESENATQALRWAGVSAKQIGNLQSRVASQLQSATCWSLLSEYAPAQQLIETALVDSKSDPKLNFDVLNARAHLLIQLGEFESAKTSSENALAIGRTAYQENSHCLFDCYQNLSESCLALGDATKSFEYATKASQLPGLDSEKGAQGLLLLGQSLLALGRIDEASEQFVKVIEIYREKQGNADLKPAAIASSSLGECLLLSKEPDKYRQAQSRFSAAIRVEERDSSNTDVLNKARNLNGLALVSYMVSKQNSPDAVSALERNFAESKLADRFALDAAACIDKYIYSAFPNLSFAQQCAFINNVNKQESSLLTVCSNPTSIKEAYGYLMKWKGLLLESLRQRELLSRNANQNPEFKKLLAELNTSRRKLVSLSYASNESDVHTSNRLLDATSDNERLERALSAISVDRVDDPMTNMNAAKFCEILHPDEAFIDILRYRPFSESEERYAAVVSRRSETGKVDYVDLGAASKIDKLIEDWRAATTSGASLIKRDIKFDDGTNTSTDTSGTTGSSGSSSTAENISASSSGNTSTSARNKQYEVLTAQLAELIAPVHKLIGDDSAMKRYWICPEGDFAKIPWNSLALMGNIIKLPEICEVDSPRELVLLRQSKSESTASNNRQLLLAGLSNFQNDGLPALPGALQEVQALQKIAQKYSIPVNACMEESATKENVAKNLGRATLAHIATHGFVRTAAKKQKADPNLVLADLTTRSGIPLTGTSRDPLLDCGIFLAHPKIKSTKQAEDILTAEEIAALDLSNCQLVTLSACQTGLGRGLDGQGVIGLRSAILSAGAKCMLMSLWSIDDEASRELMKRFYTHLWNDPKISKVEALRLAQKEIQAIPEWSGPRYWAGWVLAGDGFN